MSENALNGVVVNRHTQEQQTVSPDTPYGDISDALPFYYGMNLHLSVLLIVLGIIIGIAQMIIMGAIILLPFIKKEYRCIRCKSKYTRISKPQQCPLCGGVVISENEYLKNYAKPEDFYNNI